MFLFFMTAAPPRVLICIDCTSFVYIYAIGVLHKDFLAGRGVSVRQAARAVFIALKKELDNFILTLVLTILSSALVTVIFKNIPGSRFGAGDWVEILILNLFPLALTHIVSTLASVRILAATSTNNSYDPMGGVLASLNLPQVQELLDGRKIAAAKKKALADPVSFNLWTVGSVYANYKLAFCASLRLVYLTLMRDLLVEAGLDEKNKKLQTPRQPFLRPALPGGFFAALPRAAKRPVPPFI